MDIISPGLFFVPARNKDWRNCFVIEIFHLNCGHQNVTDLHTESTGSQIREGRICSLLPQPQLLWRIRISFRTATCAFCWFTCIRCKQSQKHFICVWVINNVSTLKIENLWKTFSRMKIIRTSLPSHFIRIKCIYVYFLVYKMQFHKIKLCGYN